MQYEASFGARRSDLPNIRASEGGGTTTLTANGSGGNANPWQVFNLSSAQTVVLPSTGVKAGDRVTLENPNAFDLTAQSSNTANLTVANGANIDATIRSGYVYLESIQDTPTTPAHWRVVSLYETGTYSLSFVTGITTTGSFLFTRTNKSVVGVLPSIVGATVSAASISTAAGAILTRHTPANNSYTPGQARVNAGNASTPGLVRVRSNGLIDYTATWDGGASTWGASGGTNGITDTVNMAWITL